MAIPSPVGDSKMVFPISKIQTKSIANPIKCIFCKEDVSMDYAISLTYNTELQEVLKINPFSFVILISPAKR